MFFFEQLYNFPDVKQAFRAICLDKLLSDGYFDMSKYIFARVRKEDMLAELIQANSKYFVLYKNSYPKPEQAVEFWKQNFYSDNLNENKELLHIESEAIVYWIYHIFKNADERIDFTMKLFHNEKELHSIHNHIKYSEGVFYNSSTIDLHFINSISQFNSFLLDYNNKTEPIFFRGHSNANYILLPSVMRNSNLKENERNLYNELLIECPEYFENCHTHLEKLVTMQHYGLPTHLLDITRNPLVALFFACENNFNSFGEVVLISAEKSEIKYPQSDVVSILSSLPLFSYKDQQLFYNLATDDMISDIQFNADVNILHLIHEVRLEKPAFEAEILKDDLIRHVIVFALKNNKRIVKQDGAFIICGLIDKSINTLNHFRYRYKNKTQVLLIRPSKKKEILKQLNKLSINRAALFPEIDFVAQYIKEKYS